MIFQNRRLILARKIVIEWRFHVLSFYIFRLNFNQIRRLFLISAAQILRRWFSALTQTVTQTRKKSGGIIRTGKDAAVEIFEWKGAEMPRNVR